MTSTQWMRKALPKDATGILSLPKILEDFQVLKISRESDGLIYENIEVPEVEQYFQRRVINSCALERNIKYIF